MTLPPVARSRSLVLAGATLAGWRDADANRCWAGPLGCEKHSVPEPQWQVRWSPLSKLWLHIIYIYYIIYIILYYIKLYYIILFIYITYIIIYTYVHYCNYRRKFRSQASDGKAEVGRVREEKRRKKKKIREEKESEERRCRCAKR